MSAVQIKYSQLFSLSIEQLFYQNKFCRDYQTEPIPDFQLIPTEECVNLMRRMDLLFRNTNNNAGCIVLGRVLGQNNAGNDLLRFPAVQGDKLSFLMILKNPGTLNFSDLPVKPMNDQLFYLANDVNDGAAPRNDLHLTKNAAGIARPGDTIKRSGTSYRFHNNVPVAAGTAKVKHGLTGAEVEPYSIINGTESDLGFELSSLPSGKCTLLINNVQADEFYLLKSELTLGLFGVIEFILSPAPGNNYRIIEADRSLTAQRPAYKIVFQNRQTKWRYSIHLQQDSPTYIGLQKMNDVDRANFLANVNIETNDNQINFQRTSVTETDFVFESQQPISLREKYFSSNQPKDVLNLTLKKFAGLGPPNEGDLKTFLPYPSPNQINASNMASIYSDIFLTI